MTHPDSPPVGPVPWIVSHGGRSVVVTERTALELATIAAEEAAGRVAAAVAAESPWDSELALDDCLSAAETVAELAAAVRMGAPLSAESDRARDLARRAGGAYVEASGAHRRLRARLLGARRRATQ